VWDGRNDAGEAVSPGVYIYTVEAGGAVESRLLTLAR
jgi:hypothetical protein